MRFFTKQMANRKLVVPVKPRAVPKGQAYRFPTHTVYQTIQQAIEEKYPHFPLSVYDKRKIEEELSKVKLHGMERLYPVLNPYSRAYHRIALKDGLLEDMKKYHEIKHTLSPLRDRVTRLSFEARKRYIESLDSRKVVYI